MDFVAIDFETANRNNNSACSIGIVCVKGKEIIDTKYYLIQPPNMEFDKKGSAIVGTLELAMDVILYLILYLMYSPIAIGIVSLLKK